MIEMPGPSTSSKNISGFDPRSIAGCQLWLDASDLSAVTGTSPVTAWRDKSLIVSSTTSYAGTPALTTNAIGGQPAILLNGSSSFTGSTTGSGTTLTVCIVGTQSNTCVLNGGLVCLGRSGQLDWNDVGSIAITNYTPAGSGNMVGTRNGSNAQPVSAGVSTPFIYILIYDGTYVNTYYNGTIQSTQNISNTGTFAFTNYVIGSRAGSTTATYWTGYIGEVIIYNTAFINSQRQAIEGYLRWKWGQNVLVNTHPFYYIKPLVRGFQPNDIAGCAVWLDGADPAGTAVVPTNGTSITTWVDKSGNSNNFTASSAATYSTLFNAISFNNNYYSSAYTAAPSTETVFIVANPSVITGAGALISGLSGARGIWVGNSGSGNGSAGVVSSLIAWDAVTATGTVTVNTTTLVTEQINAGISYISLNGSTTFNTGGTGFTNGTVTYLGRENAANFGYVGYAMEIIFYNVYLTTSQRQIVEGYLARKWNTLSSFLVTHPFYTIPPSSVAIFSPTQISGCVLWLDGNDPAGTGVIPTNGSTISAWIDKSGNSVSSTVTGTLTYQSSFANNNGSLKFSGTQYIQNTTFTLALSTKTFFMVCSSYAASTNGNPAGYIYFGNVGNVYDQQNGTAYQGPESAFANKFGFLQAYGNGGYYQSYGSPLGETPLGIYGDTQSGTSAVLYVNGAVLASPTLSYTPTTATGFRIGKRSDNLGGSAYNLYGNICEIIVYNFTMTQAQRQQVEGYLAWKWGLKNTLSSTHPYYKYQPSQVFNNINPPGLPTLNSPTNTTSTMNMSWSAGSGGTPVTFTVKVYAGGTLVTGTGGTQTINYPTTSTTFSPMTSGVAYTFYVSATNTAGTSATAGPSSSVTYTASSSVLITTLGGGSVSLGTGSAIIIECWGAGGGSSGSDNSLGAGAGGAYAKTTISVTSAFTLYYFVGTGGTGASASGTAGQSSWANISANSSPSSTSQGALAAGGNGYNIAYPNNSTQSASSIGNTIYIGGAGGSGSPENGGGGSASSAGNGSNGVAGSGTAGGNSGTGGGAGGAGGGSSYSGQDGFSSTEGGGGGGGSYNNAGGNGGAPGGAGGMGWSTQNAAITGVNTNTHSYGGDGGRGQIRYTRS